MSWFQEACKRTFKPTKQLSIYQTTLLALSGCICEEAGEIFGKIKKHVMHGHELNVAKVTEEIGDCLWYINNLCSYLNIDIEDVKTANVDKLIERYPNGFDTTRSINRKVDNDI